MFQHLEPYGGDPILSLNEDYQRDRRHLVQAEGWCLCTPDQGE